MIIKFEEYEKLFDQGHDTQISYLYNKQVEIAGYTPMIVRGVLPAATAGTPVTLLGDSDVPDHLRALPLLIRARVNGATDWSGINNLKLQDTASTPTDFATVPAALLTGDSFVTEASINVILENAFQLTTGGTPGRGLQLVADSDGTSGSDLLIVVLYTLIQY